MNRELVIHPFEPIADERSHTLILGTMPSGKSREANFYYAHPRNRFWRVIAESFDRLLPKDVEGKTKLLLSNGIALWDVLDSCEISGSDDASIRKQSCKNIAGFISGRPIQKILCNGGKAFALCSELKLALPVICLPSTSPANAAWSLERLIEVWRPELKGW